MKIKSWCLVPIIYWTMLTPSFGDEPAGMSTAGQRGSAQLLQLVGQLVNSFVEVSARNDAEIKATVAADKALRDKPEGSGVLIHLEVHETRSGDSVFKPFRIEVHEGGQGGDTQSAYLDEHDRRLNVRLRAQTPTGVESRFYVKGQPGIHPQQIPPAERQQLVEDAQEIRTLQQELHKARLQQEQSAKAAEAEHRKAELEATAAKQRAEAARVKADAERDNVERASMAIDRTLRLLETKEGRREAIERARQLERVEKFRKTG